MNNDLIHETIEELVIKYFEYKIYNESDVIFVIKNYILNDKKILDEYYIFDEFPIKLKYPRYISRKVYNELNNIYASLKDDSLNKLFEKEEYGKRKFKGDDIQGENLMRKIPEDIIKQCDVAKVNVDIAIIEREKYNKFADDNKFDYEFNEHKFVLAFKYERNPTRKLTNNNKDNKTKANTTRKDIGKINNSTYDICKDINGIKAIVSDGLAENGYFIFVSEGGQFKDKYPALASNSEDYKNGGYIYFHKINKHEEVKKIFNLNSK